MTEIEPHPPSVFGAASERTIPRVRVAAIIMKGEQVLLVRHVKDARSYWLLPGGGLEAGETMGDALRRELREEASVDIRVDDLVFVNDSIAPDGSRHVVNLYFSAEIVGGNLARGGDTRVVEARFVSADELEGLTLYPDIKRALIPLLREGVPARARYLGNIWKD
ncbi:MAG: NUDIX hydrolase [Candidatus Hydrogenedentota bacterium]